MSICVNANATVWRISIFRSRSASSVCRLAAIVYRASLVTQPYHIILIVVIVVTVVALVVTTFGSRVVR